MSTAKLLTLVLSTSPVMGYQTVSNRPFIKSFGITEIDPSIVVVREPEQVSIKRRSKPTYDLGIGKNKPLYNIEASCIEEIEGATKFLVEHESVRAYPSPLMVDASHKASSNPTTTKPKKVLPKVQLKRKATDSLSIGNDDISNIPQIRQTSSVQLDLNTVWVEMMIHSEQSKLVPAAMAI